MNPDFNPNQCAPNNGNFVGLPFTEDSANVIFIPVPWEVTVSYKAGTARAPELIRQASYQLDLYDPNVKDAWKLGIYFLPTDLELLNKNDSFREEARKYIDFVEEGHSIDTNAPLKNSLKLMNQASEYVNKWVEEQCTFWLNRGKLVTLVGGDHSTPLGFIRAQTKRHDAFGILHLDAHFDLRNAYEGFEYSHASVFYNALKHPEVTQLVSVGIRDYCQEELDFIQSQKGRVAVFFDEDLRNSQLEGQTFASLCDKIIEKLPQKVHLSFDIDALNPHLCPGTGTPVPGGLEFNEVLFLIKRLVQSGKTIIGFDLVETGTDSEWDGNVAARMLYRISNLMGQSNKLI